MMPINTLIRSNFCGGDHAEIHAAAVIASNECYDSPASTPWDPEQLVHRTSRDATAALGAQCPCRHNAAAAGSHDRSTIQPETIPDDIVISTTQCGAAMGFYGAHSDRRFPLRAVRVALGAAPKRGQRTKDLP